HLAAHPRLAGELAIEPVTAGARLVAHHLRATVFAQPLDQPIHRRRLVGDLPPIARLAVRQPVRHCHVDVPAVCIQTNVKRMLHGERSPMLEARRRPVRRNPRYRMRRGRSPCTPTDIWTEPRRSRESKDTRAATQHTCSYVFIASKKSAL